MRVLQPAHWHLRGFGPHLASRNGEPGFTEGNAIQASAVDLCADRNISGVAVGLVRYVCIR